MRLLLFTAFFILAALAAVALQTSTAPSPTPSPGTEQTRPKDNPIPEKFVNLQVLPKDISKRELMGVMKQFCITFSVRCSYCHTVSDDLTQGSFDSDDKPPKVKARELIKTIMAISRSAPAAPTTR